MSRSAVIASCCFPLHPHANPHSPLHTAADTSIYRQHDAHDREMSHLMDRLHIRATVLTQIDFPSFLKFDIQYYHDTMNSSIHFIISPLLFTSCYLCARVLSARRSQFEWALMGRSRRGHTRICFAPSNRQRTSATEYERKEV